MCVQNGILLMTFSSHQFEPKKIIFTDEGEVSRLTVDEKYNICLYQLPEVSRYGA